MIQLTYTIDADKGALTLVADADAQREIAELIDYKGANTATEADALEHLIGNSELQWIDPSDTGDLTDAPTLGILGEESLEDKPGPYGSIYRGDDGDGSIFAPIIERWAFMDYAVRSFLTDLATTGKAVFTNH